MTKLSPPAASAPIADWLAWLHSAANAFDSAPAPSYRDPWWYAETRRRIDAILHLVRDYVPWSDPRFEPLRQVPEFGINATTDQLSVDWAIGFAEQLEKKLAHAQRVSTGRQSLAEQLGSRFAARHHHGCARWRRCSQVHRASIGAACRQETEFGFLVNPGRRLLSIGYDVRNQKLHECVLRHAGL